MGFAQHKRNAILGAALFGAVSGWGQGYPQWANFKSITINTATAGVSGTLTNFPVLVRLTGANASDVFSGALSLGADIRFAKTDGTPLRYQLERWSPTSQLADFWVLVENLPGNSTTTIRMYWGRSGVASESNGAAVFATSSAFQAVWHLGTSGINDATSNGNNATNNGTTSIPALIGNGRQFDTTTAQFLTVADHPSLNPTSQITLSAWINPATWLNGNRRILQKGADNAQYGLREKTGADSLQWDLGGGAVNKPALPASLFPANTWTLVHVTYSGSRRAMYVNGALRVYQDLAQSIPVSASVLTIGGKPASVVKSDCFFGVLDEMRVSSTTRSADWIRLEYETQKANQTAVSVGATQLQPPSSLAYANNPASYTVGTSISPNTPTVSGTVTGYSVSPTLPAGLTLNTSTGVISGTPSATAAAASYIVTASNSGGSTTASVNIAVTGGISAPANLQYAVNPAVYGVGVAIAPNNPNNSGGNPTAYSVSPALPAGLSFSTSTGVVSGTPSAARAAANYTVTASNSAGSAQAVLRIEVQAPPSALSYAQAAPTYTERVAIAANAPTVTGSVSLYTVEPNLPAGLRLDSASGVISGTPAAPAPAADYVVTAANGVGSTDAMVRITVQMAAPGNLAYPVNPASYPVNAAIEPNIPSVQGSVFDYDVQPSLPVGLVLDPSSGMIWGTPTVASAKADYTITASNSAGSTTVKLNLEVVGSTPLAGTGSPAGLRLRLPAAFVDFPPATSSGRLEILDAWGRPVWSRTLAAGTRELFWDGSTGGKIRVARGIYFARLILRGDSGPRVWERKILLAP